MERRNRWTGFDDVEDEIDITYERRYDSFDSTESVFGDDEDDYDVTMNPRYASLMRAASVIREKELNRKKNRVQNALKERTLSSICVEDVNEVFNCGICSDVMTKPHQCQSGHTFCYDCITKWLGIKSTCPVCCCKLNKSTLCNNRALDVLVNEMQVHCLNWAEDNGRNVGCKWQGKLSDLEQHISNDCGCEWVICPNHGCGERIQRQYVKFHTQESCFFRPVTCNEKVVDDCKVGTKSDGNSIHQHREIDNNKGSCCNFPQKVNERPGTPFFRPSSNKSYDGEEKGQGKSVLKRCSRIIRKIPSKLKMSSFNRRSNNIERSSRFGERNSRRYSNYDYIYDEQL